MCFLRLYSEFVRYNLIRCVACVAALFTLQAMAPTKETLDAASPLKRVFSSFICVGIVFNVISLGHFMNSAFLVALGFWEPAECPPIFGDIRDAYSIRRLWG